MSYCMSGRFFEACDCYVPCPCWFQEDPDDGECSGVVAWQIEDGEIDGVSVTGLSVVSVSQHGGNREHSHQMRVVLLLDQDAGDEQRKALDEAFSGRLGGPLADLAKLTGDLTAVEPAQITFVEENGSAHIEVPERVAVRSEVVHGPTKRPITIGDGMLAILLGTPAAVGKSSRYHLSFSAAGIDIDVTGRSTTSGQFSYEHGT